MAVVTDFTQAPQTILLNLINGCNGTSATLDQIQFGIPTALTNSVSGNNTQVKVTPLSGTGWDGDVIFTYNRIDLSVVAGVNTTQFSRGASLKISDLVPEINAAYGINLTAADFVDGPLPTFAGNADVFETFMLTAAPGSLIYMGALELVLLPTYNEYFDVMNDDDQQVVNSAGVPILYYIPAP
jgi:hypothetical protein